MCATRPFFGRRDPVKAVWLHAATETGGGEQVGETKSPCGGWTAFFASTSRTFEEALRETPADEPREQARSMILSIIDRLEQVGALVLRESASKKEVSSMRDQRTREDSKILLRRCAPGSAAAAGGPFWGTISDD